MASKEESFALEHALLEIDSRGTPRSRQFEDTYFDVEDGLGESRHVFLGGCELSDTWKDLDTFTIGETGFGTGLNFLATWHAWQISSNRPRRLNYISVVGFPLSIDDLAACLSRWSELAPYAEKLIKDYPPPRPGYHRLFFEGGQVSLTLLCGPVLPMLQNLDANVDAWFLDGFAPDRNPDMWHPDVMREIARLSQPDARLATFTVAGQVRRELETVGFSIEKRAGWGKKREVLCGQFDRSMTESHPEIPTEPWYKIPKPAASLGKSVTVIGSGLAGAFAANAFQRRGCKVTVIDRHSEIATEASAAPAAVLMPRLTAGASSDGDFYASAWTTLLSILQDIEGKGHDIGRQRCGTLQLAQSADEERRQSAVINAGRLPDTLVRSVSTAEASALSGIAVGHGGLFFPDGGTLSPRLLCAALMDGVTVYTNRTAAELERNADGWFVKDVDGGIIAEASYVIVANALDSTGFQQSSWLPLTARRGQITRATPSQTSQALKCVIAGAGYLTPIEQGSHVIGATFDHVKNDRYDRQLRPTAEADKRNVEQIDLLTPGLLNGSTSNTENSWVGLRCTTSDHLPMAGPLPDHTAYLSDYSELRHGHRWSAYPNARYHDGLFVLTGLGAHGTVAAPLAAELIASQAFGDPSPVPRSIANALHPGRFIVRNLKRLKT